MSTLMRAKAALVLAALLLTTGVGPAALAATVEGGTQQSVGIVALRHAADGVQTRIILEGTAELPYTIYRPDERTILVDLPGVDASKLDDGYAVDSPGVERVQVERLRTASGQSLARLRIRLTAPVEDRTVVEGKNLVVTLTATAPAPTPAPSAMPAATKEAETSTSLRAEMPPTPAASEPVAPLRPVTTAAVPTNPATAITNVRTDMQNGTFRAYIAADGRVSFKHFVLPNPDRIVVDITGVTSRVERNAVDVTGGGVSRIRIGQFRTAEPRVVRIVFDVAKMGSYDVRQVGGNLVLSLGPGAGGDVTPPAPAPRTTVAEKPRSEPPAARVSKPMPPPVVADDKEDNPASVKPASRAETVKPTAPPKSDASKDPARNPAVMAPSTTPVRPVAEVETQGAGGRPASPRPPATSAPRPSQSAGAQAPPPAPMVPRQQQGGYLTEGFTGRPVNLELKNVDLRDVLRFLHNRFGVNFIVDRSVPASLPVDVSVKDIPWNQALDAILKANGLGAVREEGGIIRISTLPSIASERDAQRAVQASYFLSLPLVTKIYRLKYTSPLPKTQGNSTSSGGSGGGGGGGGGSSSNSNFDPESIKTGIFIFIKNRLSSRGRIEFDVRSNSLIITDLAQRLDVIEEIIRAIDRPEPQVEIEARIVVANRTFLRDLGVQLSAAVTNPARGGLAAIDSIVGSTLPDFGGQPTPTGLDTGGSLISLTTGAIGTFRISANIIAAERKGQARTIAAPRVTTQNNTTAEITNGVQIPVQTVSNNTITTTFVDAALRLQITPQIVVEDGAVLLNVIAENNNVSDLRVNGGTPGINTQSASAVVLVPDGGTTVLGGINIDSENVSEDRTPGLARIPIFGNLFKRRTTNRTTQEILFFITPRIFRPELVGLTQESTLRTSDITITPVLPVGSEGGSTVAAPSANP